MLERLSCELESLLLQQHLPKQKQLDDSTNRPYDLDSGEPASHLNSMCEREGTITRLDCNSVSLLLGAYELGPIVVTVRKALLISHIGLMQCTYLID